MVSLRKEHKNPKGGLTAKGRAAYNKATGSNLKPGVKKKRGDMSTSEMKRKGSFLRRHYGRANPHPVKDKKGKPTRYALQANEWGESPPTSAAAVRRLGKKGTRLLEAAKKKEKREKKSYDVTYFAHLLAAWPGAEQEKLASLKKWFDEEWVDVSKKKDGGGYEDCGRKKADKSEGGYPKCVPKAKAKSMSEKDKDSAVRRKRYAEKNEKRDGKSPIMVKTEKKSALLKAAKNEPTNPELYAKVKAEAKKKFDVYPSAYANGWLVKTYKARGGGYKKK